MWCAARCVERTFVSQDQENVTFAHMWSMFCRFPKIVHLEKKVSNDLHVDIEEVSLETKNSLL